MKFTYNCFDDSSNLLLNFSHIFFEIFKFCEQEPRATLFFRAADTSDHVFLKKLYNFSNFQITSERVVKLFIKRIKEVNGIVNAVVSDRFEDAIKDAIAVDELISSSSFSREDAKIRTPLLGIPFTAKESISARGDQKKIM